MKQSIVKRISVFALSAAVLTLSACKPQAEAAQREDIGESIVVSAFSQEYQDFETALGTAFSKELLEKLSLLGDDPSTGFRTAGSPAEREAAVLTEAAMRRAGLQNVTREQAPADSWVFKGASLLFENKKGERERIVLGAYPADLTVTGQALALVDAGRGRAADYEGLDVKAKLVLLYGDGEDPAENASFQALEAKLRGAAAALICADKDAAEGAALLTADFGAPADAPALAISADDCDRLKTALKGSENGELSVTLRADSVVTPGARTENIWGEIPGKSADVVYMLASCDGFYHAAFEGAAGLSAMLGIAKALCDSGFLPNKTIRFVACGAGEWGAANTPFNRYVGAWRQITQLHPEWAERAFVVLNADALYPVGNKLSLGMTATDEIYDFAERSMSQLVETGMYGFTRHSSENPSPFLTEESVWQLLGIPAAALRPGYGDRFYHSARRSSLDTIADLGFDDEAYRFGQLLLGKLILDLDETPLRPLNFERSFRAIRASLDAESVTNTRLALALESAAAAAATLAADTEAVNLKYLGSDEKARAAAETAAGELNRRLYALNRMLCDAFLRIDKSGALVLPHTEAFANAKALGAALSALQSGDGAGAAEALKTVGLGLYADYDAQVCDYFASLDHAGTPAAGRTAGPVCRTDSIIRSLARKAAEQDPDLSAETAEIEALLAGEQLRLHETLAAELSRLEEILPFLLRAIEDTKPLLPSQGGLP